MQAAGTSGSSGTQGFTGSTNMNVVNDGGRTFESSLSNPFPNGFNLPLGRGRRVAEAARTSAWASATATSTTTAILSSSSGTARLQHESRRGFLVEVGYLGSKGKHLIDGESNMTYNQLPASYFALRQAAARAKSGPESVLRHHHEPASPLSRPTVAWNQLLRPYPQYTERERVSKAAGELVVPRLHLRAEKRFSDGVNLLVSFTAWKADR